MRMKRLKRRKGELLGKRLDGVHCENRKGVRKNEIESWTMRREVFLFESFVYIYEAAGSTQEN